MAYDFRAANSSFYPSRPLVAVFIGGTSGIGESAARTLISQYLPTAANNTPASLRLYIVGRNPSAARNILSECSPINPTAHLEFIQATDLTSIKNTAAVCTSLIHIERTKYAAQNPRIDMLVMTQGALSFHGRAETTEGLDRQIALLYYSRIRAIMELMPLLEAAEAPRVVSVFAAGKEGTLIRNDLSLRDPGNFGILNARSHVGYMTTMAFERLAREHPRLSLVHAFPGMVVTPGYEDASHPVWVKGLWWLFGWAARRWVAVSLEESGARVVSLGTERWRARGEEGDAVEVGTDGVRGGGAYAVDENCRVVRSQVDYGRLRKEGFEGTVWEHTRGVFEDIEMTGRYEG